MVAQCLGLGRRVASIRFGTLQTIASSSEPRVVGVEIASQPGFNRSGFGKFRSSSFKTSRCLSSNDGSVVGTLGGVVQSGARCACT